jgi:hypothetical protein
MVALRSVASRRACRASDPVRVCVTPYAPFVMSTLFATGNGTLPGPLPLSVLNSAQLLPDGLHDPRSPSFGITGFDIDYTCVRRVRAAGLRRAVRWAVRVVVVPGA